MQEELKLEYPAPKASVTFEFPSLRGAKIIGLDIETYDPNLKTKGPGVRESGYICGVSLAAPGGWSQYYPIRHPGADNVGWEKLRAYLSEELSRPEQPKVGANILYDLDYLTHAGVCVAGDFHDVLLAEPIIDENNRKYNLEYVAQKYLGLGKETNEMFRWQQNAFGVGNEKSNIYRTPAILVARYAKSDAELPIKIFAEQKKLMEANGWYPAYLLEMGLVPMLLHMRQLGIRINIPAATWVKYELNAKIQASSKRLNAAAGWAVDYNSSKDMAMLFQQFGMEPGVTEKGGMSFDKSVLVKSELGREIMNIRKCEKLLNTTLAGIFDMQVGGRLHTQLHQLRTENHGTVSYRFSSSHPNLQNIPKRSDPANRDMVKAMRSLFLPEDGYTLMSADYSQIEYRLLCHYASGTGAEEAREAYRNDAKTDFHVYASEVTRTPRDDAKNINFMMIYGGGIGKLAEMAKQDYETAKRMYETYDSALPFAKHTNYKAAKIAERRGHIILLDKRWARFPNKDFCYTALNRLLQGGAAIVVKKAMLDLWKSGILEVSPAHLMIHDELLFSLKKGSEEKMKEAIKEVMENAWKLRVPLLVNMKTGENWGSMK